MSDVIKGSGSCLCGAVCFTAASAQTSIGTCHCDMCRKWGGGPFMSVRCERDVTFTGEDSISVYDSSTWAERGFCRICGSHLFFRLKGDGHYFLPAGLFDDQAEFELDRQVYIERKPHYYSFANQTSDLTEAEILEIVNQQQTE